MKKLMMVIGLGLIAGSVYAACMGPFCYDDRGAYVAGQIQDGNGTGVVSLTSTTINAIQPRAVGQFVWCTNCVAGNSGLGMPCVSTETTTSADAYVAVGSFTAVTACK